MAANRGKGFQALVICALGLPGLATRALEIQDAEVDFQYSRYRECCNRMEVDMYTASATIFLNDRTHVSLDWLVDAVSGSSPVLSAPKEKLEVVSGASVGGDVVRLRQDSPPLSSESPAVDVMSSATIRDQRHQLDLKLEREFSNDTLSLGGGFSLERDHRAYSIGVGGHRDFFKGQMAVAPELNFVFNQVRPVGRDIKADSQVLATSLGMTGILDKRSLLHLQLGYSHERGFLSNPYKKVFLLGGDARLTPGGFPDVFFEHRPARRHRGFVLLRYMRHIDPLDSALHLDYRFYRDDWAVRAHTITLTWYQPLGTGWQLIPQVRYYSQGRARFYRPFFLSRRSDGDYSSDYRLADFGTLSGGMALEKTWMDRLTLRASFEYYDRQAGLRLGGQRQAGFSNFNFLLFGLALKLRF